ncbi:YrzE family protein [Pseudoscardovia radai]|uniref:YrzE family protein n=1 Tax=Pseudoscardovia radai TaxID=987066 RepID=UPI00399465C6
MRFRIRLPQPPGRHRALRHDVVLARNRRVLALMLAMLSFLTFTLVTAVAPSYATNQDEEEIQQVKNAQNLKDKGQAENAAKQKENQQTCTDAGGTWDDSNGHATCHVTGTFKVSHDPAKCAQYGGTWSSGSGCLGVIVEAPAASNGTTASGGTPTSSGGTPTSSGGTPTSGGTTVTDGTDRANASQSGRTLTYTSYSPNLSQPPADPVCAQGGNGRDAKGNKTQTDITYCLPAGRWGHYIGNVSVRREPAQGLGALANLGKWITTTTRLVMPNILLMVTQVCWNIAISLSQHAASFEVSDGVMSKVDNSIGNMVTSVMSGGIPAAFVILAILALVAAAAFGHGSTQTAAKRLGVTVLCLGLVVSMGAAATRSTSSGPAKGSPWWWEKQVNGTVNALTISLDLSDSLTQENQDMMTVKTAKPASISGNAVMAGGASCQQYLYQMVQQYKTAGGDSNDSSSLVLMANTLWTETALRNWVTMQWGNPTQGSQSNEMEAENAQKAYCHVLDFDAGIDPLEQAQVTNAAYNVSIDRQTASWIFASRGWIDPFNPIIVRNDDKAKDVAFDNQEAEPYRVAVFWETCQPDQSTTDEPRSRFGWATLHEHMDDKDSGIIKGAGGSYLREGWGQGKNTTLNKHAMPDVNGSGYTPPDLIKTGGSSHEADAGTACNAIFNNVYFHSTTDSSGVDNGEMVQPGGNTKDLTQYVNYAQAAVLGWSFDVPNVEGSWDEANMDMSGDSEQFPAVRTTLDYAYGNKGVDTLGALGTVLGALCNGTILALLALVLIISKFALALMVMFLVFAFLARAFPVGDVTTKAVKNWTVYTAELSMLGMVYSVIGGVATFICSVMLNLCSSMSSTFFYNIMVGLSMGIAMVIIQVFCKKVLKVDGVFNLKSIMGMAGAGALLKPLGTAKRLARQIGTGAVRKAGENLLDDKLPFGRNRRKGKQFTNKGKGKGGSGDSENVVQNASDALAQLATAMQNGEVPQAGNAKGKGKGNADGKPKRPADNPVAVFKRSMDRKQAKQADKLASIEARANDPTLAGGKLVAGARRAGVRLRSVGTGLKAAAHQVPRWWKTGKAPVKFRDYAGKAVKYGKKAVPVALAVSAGFPMGVIPAALGVGAVSAFHKFRKPIGHAAMKPLNAAADFRAEHDLYPAERAKEKAEEFRDLHKPFDPDKVDEFMNRSDEAQRQEHTQEMPKPDGRSGDGPDRGSEDTDGGSESGDGDRGSERGEGERQRPVPRPNQTPNPGPRPTPPTGGDGEGGPAGGSAPTPPPAPANGGE